MKMAKKIFPKKTTPNAMQLKKQNLRGLSLKIGTDGNVFYHLHYAVKIDWLTNL